MRTALLAISVLFVTFVINPAASAQTYEMQLDSVAPTSAPAGATVRLMGRNFGAAQAGHRVVIRHQSAVLRNMSVTSWSNTQIVAVVPADAMAGANSIAILNPTGQTGPVNASRHVPFTVLPSLKPGVAPKAGFQTPGGASLPQVGPKVQIKPAGCADPSIVELRPGWPRRNADGTYTFHLLAVSKNIGTATFESQRRQTQITLREGPRVLKSEVWSSPRADLVILAPGQGFSSNHVIERWNPTSEFLADFTAELSYDPDIRIDSNPKNDDCVMTNNKKTLTVAELRRLLSSVR